MVILSHLCVFLIVLTHLSHCFYTWTQLEDAGRYSCLAISAAGDDDKQFLVRVHGG